MARDLQAIIADLKQLADSGDPEGAHGQADDLLLEAIEAIEEVTGFGSSEEIKSAFLAVPRWYA